MRKILAGRSKLGDGSFFRSFSGYRYSLFQGGGCAAALKRAQTGRSIRASND